MGTSVLLSLLAAAPVITNSGGDDWAVDGKPLAEACESLRGAREAVLSTNGTSQWKSVEPAIHRARACGVTRLALQLDNGAPAGFALEHGDDPVVFVGRKTHVVHDGASVAVELERDATLFWRAFPTMTRPCLAVAKDARMNTVAEVAGQLARSAGDRMVLVCLLSDDSVTALPSSERGVVEVLRGTGGEPAGTQPSGYLTRWFGSSVAPVSEEKEVPKWTRITNVVCRAEGGTQIWGVGTVNGIRNHSLARVTADNRARASIAAAIQTHVSHSKGATKTFTAQTLSGVQIVDHYFDDKSTWALATMDTSQQKAEPCPTGSEVVRSWTWKNLDPTGGFGGDRPAWANIGLQADDDHLWLTTSSRAMRPLAETETMLETLARSRLTAALASGALEVPGQRRTDTGGDCLLSVPWAEVGNAAPVETWYDVNSGALAARASLKLDEVRGALGPGCAEKLVADLVVASRRSAPASSHTTAPFVPANVKYPEWVKRGSGPANDNKRVFYGVGSVSGIKNHALARTTADNRARAEIAKQFEVYSATLMRDYMRAGTKGRPEEQHIGMAIKTFSAQTLSGVQVIDHWFHPDGTVYALARLDLDTFATNLGKMREINKQVREYVRKNAERVHQQLMKEERGR